MGEGGGSGAYTRLVGFGRQPHALDRDVEALRGAWRRHGGLPPPGTHFARIMHLAVRCLDEVSESCCGGAGPVAWWGSQSAKLRKHSVAGFSDPHVFPVPPISRERLGGAALFRVEWTNLNIWVVNLLYGGSRPSRPAASPPTAAQRRVQAFLAARVASSSSSTCRVRDEESIRATLRHEHGYSRAGYTLPLGSPARVPTSAANQFVPSCSA